MTKSKEVEGYLFTVRGLVIIRRKSRKGKNKKQRDRQANQDFQRFFNNLVQHVITKNRLYC